MTVLPAPTNSPTTTSTLDTNAVRGVWITTTASTALNTKENIKQTVANCKLANINNLFVVVYNSARTTYPSAVMQNLLGVPILESFSGRDPLKEIIDEAHAVGLKVHAWFEYGFDQKYYKASIAKNNFDLIIIDEATAYKTVTTKRWKTLNAIIKAHGDMWLWMMTGTPAAQSPTDAFGLAKMCVPDNVPRFFGAFRDLTMVNVSKFRWIPRPNANDVVFTALQPAIRFTKEECIDLPEITHVFRDAPLTAQQEKYYKLLKKEMLMVAAGEEVSTVNAAINLNKLLQISGGAVYSDTGAVVEFDVSNRLRVIEEVIDEASHKVLVFVPFTHTIELLSAHLRGAGITCEVINGAVPVHRRTEIFKDFQETENIKVLVIQPQAAAHGVTLTAANVIIWYSPVTSIETYLQANARIHRKGQKNPMTVVHIKGSPVETRLYQMLQNKLDVHSKIIDLYKNEINT